MGYCLKKLEHFLRRSFYRLGYTVAEHYGYFIMIPLFLTALLATGFQRIKYEDDPEYLFSPRSGFAKRERAIIEENFSLNFSSNFSPSRITRLGRFARLLIMAKDEGNLLRSAIWNDIVSVDRLVHSVSVNLEDRVARYDDLCAIWDSKCYENNILGLQDFMKEIEKGNFSLSYPFMLNPETFETIVFPLFFGGVKVDNNTNIVSVKALSLFYWLKTNDAKETAEGALWEDALLKALENRDFGNITVARFISRTLELELENNTISVSPFFGLTVFTMIVFSVGSALSGDWVRTKPWLGVLGVLSVSLSCVAAFGFLVYIGLDFIGINMAAPFLLLGIGMDDVFVMLSAWRRTKLQDTVQERMGHAFADAAVGITITSVTDVISFFIGAITPFPSVQIFSLYTGMAVVVAYFWHITFFGGCLAFSGFMEKEQRHGLVCLKIKPKSEAVDAGCCYRVLCTGGISENDPWNQKDNKDHIIMVFFRDYFARILNIPLVKAIVIIVFMLYLAVACWGCTTLNEGLERRRLSRDDSYSVLFYEREDKYFREFPYRIQVVITGDVEYSDPKTQEELLVLLKKFESTKYSGSPIYTESWLRAWLGFVKRNQEFLGFNITSEEDFCTQLKELYLSGPANAFAADVRFNEEGTRIIASRFIIQSYNVTDGNADKDMMQEFRKVALDSKFNVTVFNPYFIFFDQFTMVRITSVEAICVSAVIMMFVSLIFIPNPLCSLWVVFSITSVEIGVVGYMAFWNVSLDSISMINLIMCIGFSVDFSAHISHAYLVSEGETPDERVKDCLYTLGLPILQGGCSTILGVTALVLAPSYIFVTFFKTVFLVIFLGVLHGIILLPVLLSLMGPGSCSKKKVEDTPPTMENAQPFYVYGTEKSLWVDPNNMKIPRPRSVTTVQNGTTQVTPLALSRNGASPAGPNAVKGKHTSFLEKDLGLGTSSEISSESSLSKEVIHRRYGSDKVNDSGARSGPHVLKGYSNNAYESDNKINEKRRIQKDSNTGSALHIKYNNNDRYDDWDYPRRNYHGSRSPPNYSSPLRFSAPLVLTGGQSRHPGSRDKSVHRSLSLVAQHGSKTSSKSSRGYRERS
nr:patched domain-containing protein 3-like [Cherax quadricarinatus]XP_053643839.1 patched domain-containing protein 3-like [Cherax quadricarinatus]